MIVRVITDGSKMEKHDPVFVRKDGRVSSRELNRPFIGTFQKYAPNSGGETFSIDALIEIP